MSTDNDIDPEIERIAHEVLDEYDQPDTFKTRFINFYENAIQNNLGRDSLKTLIEQVELSEEEELDGS